MISVIIFRPLHLACNKKHGTLGEEHLLSF